MPASTLHYGAREGTGGGGDGGGAGGPAGRGAQPSPVELASIAHVPATLSIPRIHYAPTRSSGTRLFDGRERVSLVDLANVEPAIDIRDRDRGAMSLSSVSMNVRMDNA